MSPEELATYLDQRERWIGGLIFDAAPLRSLRALMAGVLRKNLYSPPGAKTLLAVNGPFTAGKSTQVRAWAQDYYRSEIGDRIHDEDVPTWRRSGVVADEVPVVWIDLDSNAKIRNVNVQLLSFLGYPTGGIIADLNIRVARAIETHRVNLVVVDDANLLKFAHKDVMDVLDHLKHINTVLGRRGGSLVLVGGELEKSQIFDDPQIQGRLRVVQVRPFGIDTPDEVASWQDFLHEIEKMLLPYLPAARPGILAGTHAPRIWRRTQGYLGDVADLVRGAAGLAALDGSWTIKAYHLDQVPLSARATRAEPTAGSSPAEEKRSRGEILQRQR